MIAETRKAVKNFDTETKIRLLIALINDDGKDRLKSSIDKLISRLNENIKINCHLISKYLIKSIIFIPIKTPIYALILSLLYNTEKDLVEEVINRIIDYMHTPFDSLRIPIRLVSFLFECYNMNIIRVILIKTLIKYLLQSLSNLSSEVQSEDPKKLDLYLFILISNLPYIAEKLNKDDSDFLLDILIVIEGYFSDNRKNNIKKIFSSTKKDYLLYFWETIFVSLKNNKTTSDLFIKPDPEYEVLLSQRKQESLYSPKIKFFINLEHVESTMWSSLQVFEENMIEKYVPRKLDRLIIQEKIEDILEAFEDNIDLCVKYILNLNYFYGYEYEIDLIVVETIFSLMLRLPKSKAKLIFYSSLLVNLSKKASKEKKSLNLAPIITNVVQSLFHCLEEMDIECVERLSQFFSFFLSNFQFIFDFEKFQEILTLPDHDIKCIFFKHMVGKMCNLAGKSKIMASIVNEQYHSFFPKDDKPYWKFSDPNETYYYDSQVICDNILAKKEYNTWVDKYDSVGNDFVYVFMSCMFYCKSKTLSHLRESLTFYKNAIVSILTTKDQKLVALEALRDIWGHFDVYFVFIFDLMLKYSFVDCFITIRWIFDKLLIEPKSIPLCYLHFDLINILVNSCTTSISRIQKELSKEQENMAKSDEGFHTNIIKNIETYEETLEKYFEIEKKVYHEIVIKFVNIYSQLKAKNVDSYILDHLYNRLIQFIRNYKSYIVKNIGKINEFYLKYQDKQDRIAEILKNLIYF